MTFPKFFEAATGHSPYCWQGRLANGENFELNDPETQTGRPCSSMLIDIPTGLGKTAAVVMAWLWNRVALGREDWPRRLMYCLPMRTLVEQTRDEAREWIHSLIEVNQLPELHSEGRPRIVVLMGGESQDADEREWDIYPEQNCILIGTQDMLLSRALNRGYGMSRYRWPMHFALLNNDALWVMDEVQLMGAGLASTTQLEGFRRDPALGSRLCASWWMSATIRPDWLGTVDFPADILASLPVRLTEREKTDGGRVEALRTAVKFLCRATVSSGNKNAKAVADYIAKHRSSDRLTLVVVNTVKRARDLHQQLSKRIGKGSPAPILLHSQLRPDDRLRILEAIHSAGQGQVVVSTQVIEAGVDLSAHTLFTELAPWSSLVQRFGRCNRHLKDGRPQFTDSSIHWFDLDCEKEALPYETARLQAARKRLEALESAAIADLEAIPSPDEDQPRVRHVVRRKDIVDLFDTTPDLAGADLDIDRFVRDAYASHIQVFWRNWAGINPNGNDADGIDPEPRPRRPELCAVARHEFSEFLENTQAGHAWRWNPLDQQWRRASADAIFPGQTYLLHCGQGGYAEGSAERLPLGWTGNPQSKPTPVAPPSGGDSSPAETTDDDPGSVAPQWQTIAEHTGLVCTALADILDGVAAAVYYPAFQFGAPLPEILQNAARWHDWGKAHPAFQAKLRDAIVDDARDRGLLPRNAPVAKAPDAAWRKGRLPDRPKVEERRRKHFRHELASALGLLHPESGFPLPASPARDLAAYLVAAHHGKVRLSIRSLPGEWLPSAKDDTAVQRRFARGVWDGDSLPEVDLGGSVRPRAVELSLEPMELGLCEEEPFAGQPSWAERALTLRDALGPFLLTFLETLLRAADARGSTSPQHGAHPLSVEEASAPFATGTGLTPEQAELARAIADDGLSIQDRFRPEPNYKRTGKGHYESRTVEDMQKARRKGAQKP
jgi:CRISPR-associated endonuclease/helicase Cas3